MGLSSRRWTSHRIVALAIGVVALFVASSQLTAASPPEEIGPEFEGFHAESGGIRVFGYAVSPRVIEDGNVAQYFERQRLEFHPENPDPYNVLLGRLGSEEARQRGLTETPAFQPVSPEQKGEDCRYFEETGHQVCNGFLDYWEQNGLNLGDSGISERESVSLFGYPISEEFTDPETGLTTQYFERARFEYHEENEGTQYETLLGRLGSPLWQARAQYAEAAPEPTAEVMSSAGGQQIADLGMQYVGYPYVWGAEGPNAFDCTGFTSFVVSQATGQHFTRDMYAQARTGSPVPRDQLQPGDLVFHQNTYRAGLSHAGIYIGDGRFVHAANPSTGVTVSDLDSGYWGPRFHSARRVAE